MSRDTSFYYSFLVLPARKRRAIVAVWDFCRAVDDAVDEAADSAAPESAAAELSMWRAELEACYVEQEGARTGTGGPKTSQGKTLKPYIREFNLPRAPFEDLIDGVAMDLDDVRYPTFEALADYCRRVASTVGLICIEIFGYRDPASRTYAVDLGMALQLTNIVRDVAADLQQGRLYLPVEDLERFGVTEDALRQGQVTPAVRDLLRFECERAREYYARAAAVLPRVDARSLVAAEIMGGIYFGILRRIERAGYDVFSRRIRVPRPARALIALRIWARTVPSRLRPGRPGPGAQDPTPKAHR
ncbi:MAG: presqualene diphosphate synthase HpnD [Acidobacteria bacterium]|nr:presqualene diphosphate synthase HpnD [Acidobacteriota bacterium]